jgi:alpha-ribazole phosphatase
VTRLWLVRHGPTHTKAFAGWRDIPADLSDMAALQRLSDWLPRDAILVSSDLVRASATADAIANGRRRLSNDRNLREFHFGEWDGLPFDHVSSQWPDLSRMYWQEPGHVAPPGGESWLQGAARMDQAVDTLIATHQGHDIVVVAHFGVILTQIQRALGISPFDALAQPIDNLSVSSLSFEAGQWQAHQINHKP